MKLAFQDYHTKKNGNLKYLVHRGLLPCLKRLDCLLEIAVAKAKTVYGASAPIDKYRGLYISEEEVKGLLNREPGSPLLWTDLFEMKKEKIEPTTIDSQLVRIQTEFQLSSFDIDTVIIALAPEIDLRYERIYAYLQDNVTYRKPSVDLILNLLCSSAQKKLERRAHFFNDAPLIRHGLIRLLPDPNQLQPPFLSHYVKIDKQITHLLLGFNGLDPRLADFTQLIEPSQCCNQAGVDERTEMMLKAFCQESKSKSIPAHFYFHGPVGTGKRSTAEALARSIGSPLLVADIVRVPSQISDFLATMKTLLRETWLEQAILYIEGIDVLIAEGRDSAFRELLKIFSDNKSIIILSGSEFCFPSEITEAGIIPVEFFLPDFERRLQYWKRELDNCKIILSQNEIAVLAGRFTFTYKEITAAVRSMETTIRCKKASRKKCHSNETISDLFAAAREQTGKCMASIARKVMPKDHWNDIVLPEDTMAQLREMCQWVAGRNRVMHDWGFERKLSLGKGTSALFAGPSGTGKTMAAGVIANELNLDLYKIDLSQVVSKYIGETEKNLDRIFSAAENSNGILFFDEADSLFGKRSEVKDAHDRYANIEISYLLQKIEEYEGLIILASNLRQNLDEAFVRRIAFMIHFNIPDEASRYRIWTSIWPSETPLANNIDFGYLAREFKLSGGNIKNVALAAAFLASEKAQFINVDHILHALHREYQKIGKSLSKNERQVCELAHR